MAIGRLAGVRAGIVVHQRHPAPARAGSGRGDQRKPGPATGDAQPGDRAGDGRTVPAGSSAGAGPLPAGPASRCSSSRRESGRRSHRSAICGRIAACAGECWPRSPSPTVGLGTTRPRSPVRCTRCSRQDPGGEHQMHTGGRRRTARSREQRRGDDDDGDDRIGQGRTEPHRCVEALLPPVGDGGAAALRRWSAHRLRPGGGRGRARHRGDRAPAAAGDRRGVRLPERVPRARLRWPAQGQPLHRPGGQGRRGAGPPDRPARRARTPGARPAAARRLGQHLLRRRRLARRLPRPRLAHRAGPLLRAGDHLPRPGVGPGPGRRRPPDRGRRQGARGARRRPGRGQGRRRHRGRC